MTVPTPQPLLDLRALAERIALVAGASRVLSWDERVGMPLGGSEGRARQRAWIAGELHELGAGAAAREVVGAAHAWDPEHPEVRAMRSRLEPGWRIPTELAARAAATAARAHHAWQVAREADDFAAFLPHLRELLAVAREQAAAVGFEQEPYEALLRHHEPGAQVDVVVAALEGLATRTAPLVHGAAAPVDSSILDRPLPRPALDRFERELLTGLGFDWERGRVDATSRAFCTTLGAGDVRLTTRLHELPGLRNLHSSMHEAGHGIYAQALQRLGLPATIAEVAGLGLDESQSRTFERFVGSSPAFWSYHFPRLVDAFPETFAAREEAAFVAAMCAPEVDLLRIDSGEAAYNLHVLLRLRLERAMVSGDLEPAGLPAAWNDGMRELLGLEVPDDAHGCLQDVHWAIGQWGYFPTYSLGNLYAAQLLEAARADLPGLDAELAGTGSTRALRDWYDAHVYAHGCSLTSHALVELATGSAVSEEPLVRHLERRFG